MIVLQEQGGRSINQNGLFAAIMSGALIIGTTQYGVEDELTRRERELARSPIAGEKAKKGPMLLFLNALATGTERAFTKIRKGLPNLYAVAITSCSDGIMHKPLGDRNYRTTLGFAPSIEEVIQGSGSIIRTHVIFHGGNDTPECAISCTIFEAARPTLPRPTVLRFTPLSQGLR